MERPPIGTQNGYEVKTEDIYVYNRTGANSVVGDCWVADITNSTTLVTSPTAVGADPAGPNMNFILLPVATGVAKNIALLGIVQEVTAASTVANGLLTRIRIRGSCTTINATNVGAAGAAIGSGLLVNTSTGTAGKLDVQTAIADVRYVGYNTSAHTAAAGAEALSGVFDGTALRK